MFTNTIFCTFLTCRNRNASIKIIYRNEILNTLWWGYQKYRRKKKYLKNACCLPVWMFETSLQLFEFFSNSCLFCLWTKSFVSNQLQYQIQNLYLKNNWLYANTLLRKLKNIIQIFFSLWIFFFGLDLRFVKSISKILLKRCKL